MTTESNNSNASNERGNSDNPVDEAALALARLLADLMIDLGLTATDARTILPKD